MRRLLSEPADLTLSMVFSSDSHVLVKTFTTCNVSEGKSE